MKIQLLLLGGNSLGLAWCDLHSGGHLSDDRWQWPATYKWQEVDATMNKLYEVLCGR